MNAASERLAADNPEWSWRRRFSMFLGFFGGIWLFTEPLLAFLKGTGLLSSLGLWSYAVLIVCSASLTALIECIDRVRKLAVLSSLSLSGIAAFHSKRSALTTTWWEQFFSESKNAHQVLVMGQSISRAFNNPSIVRTFIKWCNSDARVRVLFLSPSNAELAQLQNVGKGMIRTFDEDPAENLEKKIYRSIADLEDYVISKVPEVSRKPLVRYATRDLPFSLMAVDDDMVVTLYGTQAEADEQPALLVNGEESEAYRSFKAEFERIWQGYSKVSPYEDPIIAGYKKDWQRHIGLRNYSIDIPPPRQAIIFPTYRCQERCSYCMFQEARSNGDPEEMDPEALQKAITELIRFGVECFEISGGGEPLEHRKAEEIISRLGDLRTNHPHIRLGLLTNGCHLGDYAPSEILEVFNDYIRVTRYERIGQVGKEEELAKWKRNITALLASKRSDPLTDTKIGIKYLLTPSNQDRFVQMVRDDLNDRNLSNVDHLRFRSDRRVDKDTVAEVEQQVYYIVKALGLFSSPDRVSLSLPNFVYPRNYRCWISPMNVVIVPNGEVYVCCNYLHDRNSKCLGNILTHDFENMWRSPRHQELRRRLRRVNCDRQEYCNCRYAEIQETLERIALTAGM